MSMIEQVALAMEAHCRDVMESRDDAPDIYRRLARSEWQELARIAIEAMREPTEAVGREAFNHVATDDWLDFLRGHRAMIDAALEETK